MKSKSQCLYNKKLRHRAAKAYQESLIFLTVRRYYYNCIKSK